MITGQSCTPKGWMWKSEMKEDWLGGSMEKSGIACLFVCLIGFLKSSSTTKLYRGRAPRQSVWQFYVLQYTRQSGETITSASVGHIILTPTQPVGNGRLQRESNPRPPHQESRALPTELPRPPKKVGSEQVPKLSQKEWWHNEIMCSPL